jgi:integrase/recombinase XerD
MLRQGASLQEISTLLRHRSIETTQIYAKVDVTGLQQIAQPWPQVRPC